MAEAPVQRNIQQMVLEFSERVGWLQQQGHYQQALTVARQALELAETHLGPEHPETARSLNNIGFLLQSLGGPTEARPYLERALKINEKILGRDHLSTGVALNNMGGLLHAMGDLVGAQPYFERSLEIHEKVLGSEHPDTARAFGNLGSLFEALGNLAKARQYHERALNICEKVLGPENPATARSLNNLAGILESQGDLAGARPFYERSLRIHEKSLGPEHPVTALILQNLGVLLQSMGDLVGARRCFDRALQIREKALGPEHPDTASSCNSFGGILKEMGDLTGALPYVERALFIHQRVFGLKHHDVALCLNNLGYLQEMMGHSALARMYYLDALKIYEEVLGPEHPTTARTLNNLAALLENMGKRLEARPYYERALNIQQKALGHEHPQTALTLNNLGHLLASLDDRPGARTYIERALMIRQKVQGPNHPATAASLSNLACLLVGTDRESEAFPLMKQAAASLDNMVGQISSLGSESQTACFLMNIHNQQSAFLSYVMRKAGSLEVVQAGMDLILRRKAVTAEVLAAQRDAVLGGKYPALEAVLRQLTDLRRQIARKTMAGPGQQDLQVHEQQLSEWIVQKETLEAQMARQLPEMYLEQKLRKADRRTVAQALKEDVILIEFVLVNDFDFDFKFKNNQWRPARYLAFVLAGGHPDEIRMVDLGEAEPIDRMIVDFRSHITGFVENKAGRHLMTRQYEPSAATQVKIGSDLRAAVFDPLAPALAGCQRLLLAPDGDLARLPFEILPNADGNLVIDAFQISYLGAGRDVLRFGVQTTNQPTAAIVVADPDFDLSTESTARQFASSQPKQGFWSRWFGYRRPAAPRLPESTIAGTATGRCSRDLESTKYHFARLPGSREEGERIASLLGVTPWLEQDALEGRLKQNCRSPHILHLATHGFFLQDQLHDFSGDLDLIADPVESPLSGPLPENPLLRAGLALAGVNTWLKQGLLPSEAEDGLLTAEDVSGLDLLATDLVVLSACETGLGEVRTGQGVFGLQRAFVLAGARTLVISLWSVPDAATCELMEDFYRRLLEGEGKADALRKAQLALRAKYPDPYLWGAFVCLGDPGPLRYIRESSPGNYLSK